MDEAMAVLDPAQVADLRKLDGGRGATLARLVDKFAASVGARVESICGKAGAAQWEAFAAEAHSLKGASGNLGAARLAALCSEIERAARSGDVALAARGAERLPAESAASVAALMRETGRGA